MTAPLETLLPHAPDLQNIDKATAAQTKIAALYRGRKVRQQYGEVLIIFKKIYPSLMQDVHMDSCPYNLFVFDLWGKTDQQTPYAQQYLPDREEGIHTRSVLINNKAHLFDSDVIQTARLIAFYLYGAHQQMGDLESKECGQFDKGDKVIIDRADLTVPVRIDIACQPALLTVAIRGSHMRGGKYKEVYRSFVVEMDSQKQIRTLSNVRIIPNDEAWYEKMKRSQGILDGILTKHPGLKIAGHFPQLKASPLFLKTIGLQEPLCVGDLTDLIFILEKEVILDDVTLFQRLSLVCDCIPTLKALHAEKLVNGDVKADNILIKIQREVASHLSAYMTDHDILSEFPNIYIITSHYPFWDPFTTCVGGVCELADIYGLAFTLGVIVLGSYFFHRVEKGVGFALEQYEANCARVLTLFLKKQGFEKPLVKFDSRNAWILHLQQLLAGISAENAQDHLKLEKLLKDGNLFVAITDLLKSYFEDQQLITSRIKGKANRGVIFQNFCNREYEKLQDAPLADALKRSLSFMDRVLAIREAYLS